MKKEQVMAEPFRIKVVEPIRLISREAAFSGCDQDGGCYTIQYALCLLTPLMLVSGRSAAER
jgi:hypothetical protein